MPSKTSGRSRGRGHAYTQDDMDSVSGIALPQKIKCSRCSKSLSHIFYSNKQLTDVRYQVMHNRKITQLPKCQRCTGQQLMELECYVCNKTKGLEDFAKTQVNNPDSARCFKCTENHIGQTAINDEVYEQNQTAFQVPQSSDGRYLEYFSSAASNSGSSAAQDEWDAFNSKNDQEARSKYDDDESDGGIALSSHFQRSVTLSSSYARSSDLGNDYPLIDDPDNQWKNVRNMSWHTKSTGTTSTGSNFDPNRYGKPSSASATGTQRSFPSGVTERSEVHSNDWAKKSDIPLGINTGAAMRPMGDSLRDSGSGVDAWQSDEEESEDESEDDDDSGDDTVI